MPFNITNITFADEFNTGTTTQLNGNVSDIITATIDVSYSNIIDAFPDAGLIIYGRSSDVLSNINPSSSDRQCFVLDDGFNNDLSEYQNGVEIKFQQLDGTTAGTFTVDFVGFSPTINGASKVIVCQEVSSLTSDYNDYKIIISEAITDCNLEYKFSGSSNSNDFDPAIEIQQNAGLIPTFKTTNSPLDATTGTDTIPFKYTGAYETGSLTIEGTGINSITLNGSTATNAEQTFQLVHTFRATPISIYNDGNFEPSGYQPAINSLGNVGNVFKTSAGRYAIRGYFSNQVNGGCQLPFELERQAEIATPSLKFGNSGTTNYSISSFNIVRTSDSEVTGVPIVEQKFTVTFDIDNTTDTPFSDTNTKVKVGIENLPESIDNTEDYEQTFLSDYSIATINSSPTPVSGSATGDAASITNYTATYNSTSSVSISFDVEFTSGAQTQILDNNKYWFTIYAETQDHTLDYTNSDRVVLEAFSGEGIKTKLADPISINTTQFITAPYDSLSFAVANTNVDGFPVQLLVGSSRFSADWTNRDNLRIDTITQKLVLQNSSTSEEIEIEGASIPVNTLPLIDSKYPDADYEVIKGFKIPTTEVRNLIKFYNRIDLDSGNVHNFELQFPFFIRWEDYTSLGITNTPSSIIDTAEPLNGVNYDLYRIDQLANWDVYYRLTFNCSEDGTFFEQDFDYQLTLSDYDSHPDVTTRELKLFKEDGVTSLINGGVNYVESSEKTLVQFEWTFSSPPSATTDFEIEFYIEAFENGSPTKIQRISSVNTLLSGSWFSSINSDGLVDKSISGSKAIGKAYINDETLINYDNYKLYATIYSPKSQESSLVAENGDNLVAENADNLITE